MRTCKICGAPAYAKGLCSAHYQRQRRHGDPKAVLSGGPARSAVRRYLDETGDWETMPAFAGERTRKKFLKALNRLHAALIETWDYDAPEDLFAKLARERSVMDAIELARAIAFDPDRDGFNFSKLERETERLLAKRTAFAVAAAMLLSSLKGLRQRS